MKRLLWLVALMLPGLAFGADLPLFSVKHGSGADDYSINVQILLLMTALSFLPAMLLMLTSFTRIIIVLAVLRQALGLQQSPPNKVLIGIALTLTILIMRPVWTDIYDNAFVPFDSDQISLKEAFGRAEKPLRTFMLKQTKEPELEQMLRIAHEPLTLKAEEVPFTVLMPAFVLSELKTAFQIGFMLFLPFLIIDLVVASVLMAMGMMMLSPLIISLPFKLMIFVLVDGWAMTVGSLTASFG
ncbi:flagellar type III secretion system pore protein FliP [Gallaecimonas kandeliae]|uniref:flagellar type III secretion system pore protein FliP n=1 Tax=Gallaecimonas kandeliae TaxID=3029055 RepID=UPI002647D0FE|nr:flagellar type III secretion system pore protein FliP [Gallaecimonas kandeliae]WKE66515.1 flagellar type III secretion system pore protein FliP [Gallaecimonas kandeliae]